MNRYEVTVFYSITLYYDNETTCTSGVTSVCPAPKTTEEWRKASELVMDKVAKHSAEKVGRQPTSKVILNSFNVLPTVQHER